MNPQLQSVFDQFKTSNPPPTSSGSSDWYSGVQAGTYRPAGVPAPATPTQTDSSGGFGEVAGDIGSDVQKRSANVSNIKSSNEAFPEKLFQTGGQAAGLIGDAAVDTIKPAIRPQIKQAVKNVVGAIGNTPEAQAIGQAYAAFKAAHPEAAANLEATGNYASLLPVGGGADIAAKGVAEGTEAAGKLASETLPAVGGAVKDAATKAASKVGSGASSVTGAADKLVATPIPKSVATALKQTPTKDFDTYTKIAQDAVTDNKNPTPLEFAGRQAQSALDTIQRKLTNFGKSKSDILSKAAIGNKPVGNIVTKFRQDLSNAAEHLSVDGDSALVDKIQTAAKALGSNPAAKDVDRFIDQVQDHVYAAKRDLTIPVTDAGTSAVRKVLGQLNTNLKSQLPQSYSNVNKLYSNMVDTKNELNLKLGQEGEKGGALMKRVFSPSDANTKSLFADVKTHTGVDLVNHATLAKYMMDTLGDARQKSMLEQLNLGGAKPSAATLTKAALDKATQMANSPERMIARARALTIGAQPK